MDESSSVEIQIQQGLEDMRIEDKMAFVDDQIDLPKSPGRTVDMSALIGFDSDGDIHEFSQEHGLSAEQQEVLKAWLAEGVQSNTSIWFQITRAYFADADPQSRDKYLSTILFMDAMNRADEIFDTRRDLFTGKDKEKINGEIVDSLPIMTVNDEKNVTVKDMRNLVLKIIETSHEYSHAELDHIRWQMEHFLDVSTEYQATYEGRTKYSFDEALALRFATVGPLVDTFANIYTYSADTISSGDREQKANQAISGFRRTVLAWQLSDDVNDLTVDRRNKNINLVSGILQEEGEDGFEFDDYVDYDNFVYSCPRTAARLEKIYADLTSHLSPAMKYVLDSRVPDFFSPKWDDEYFDEEEEAA